MDFHIFRPQKYWVEYHLNCNCSSCCSLLPRPIRVVIQYVMYQLTIILINQKVFCWNCFSHLSHHFEWLTLLIALLAFHCSINGTNSNVISPCITSTGLTSTMLALDSWTPLQFLQRSSRPYCIRHNRSYHVPCFRSDCSVQVRLKSEDPPLPTCASTACGGSSRGSSSID